MKQYQFEMTNKASQRIEHARATAATPEIARAQIVLTYGSQFTIAGLFSDINPPHRVIGEIDCSDFPQSEFAWLEREANKFEQA